MASIGRTLLFLLLIGCGLVVGGYAVSIHEDINDTDIIGDFTESNSSSTESIKDHSQDSTHTLDDIEPSPVNRSYTVSLAEDGTATVTSRIRIVTDEPYEQFKQHIRLPSSDATVHSARDTQSDISYEHDDKVVTLESNAGDERYGELFTVEYEYNATHESVSDDLMTHEIETTATDEQSIRIETDEPLLTASARTPHKYDIKDEHTVVVRGEGTAQMHIVTGEPTSETEHFAFIDEGDIINDVPIDEVDTDYNITRGTLGFDRDSLTTHPVILQSDEDYDSSGHASGSHRGGIIYIPESTVQDENTFHSVLAHEAAHALNYQISPYIPRWFDEGTAMYVEATVADYRDEVYVYPFTEEQYHPEYCDENPSEYDDCYQYSSGTNTEELYEYIEDQQTSMKERQWHGDTSFEYSFSALMLNIIATEKYDSESLGEMYETLFNNRMELRQPENAETNTEPLLSMLEQPNLIPCDQYAATHGEPFPTQETVNNCVDTYYYTPSYPDSVGDSYSAYNLSIEHVEAESP